MGLWWKNYHYLGFIQKNILFLFREVFGPLNILRPYAVDIIVIPTWKLCQSNFHESKQQTIDLNMFILWFTAMQKFIHLDRFRHPKGDTTVHCLHFSS